MPRMPKKINKNIGRNIARIRKAKGYSQQQIAYLIGVTQPAFGNYERGDREVPFSTIEDLASLFDVPLSFLSQGIPDNISDDDIRKNSSFELKILASDDRDLRDLDLKTSGELTVSFQVLSSIFGNYWYRLKSTNKVPKYQASVFLQILSLRDEQKINPNDVPEMLRIFEQTAAVFYSLMYDSKIASDPNRSVKGNFDFSKKLSKLIDEDGYFKFTDL